MSTERQKNAASLSRVVAFTVFLSLIAFSGLSLTGCSNAAVEEPVKKKKPVQDLNIQSPTKKTASSAGGSVAKEPVKPKDAIESLPFEPEEQKKEVERELPVLGE